MADPLSPSGSLPDHQDTHPAVRAAIEALGGNPWVMAEVVAQRVVPAVLRWAGDEYARDGERLAGLREHAAAAGQYVAAAKAETWANQIEEIENA